MRSNFLNEDWKERSDWNDEYYSWLSEAKPLKRILGLISYSTIPHSTRSKLLVPIVSEILNPLGDARARPISFTKLVVCRIHTVNW